MEQRGDQNEVRLYRWPPVRGEQYVSGRGMIGRLLVYVTGLALAFGGGVMWSSLHHTGLPPINQEPRSDKDKESVKQCCTKDVRTAQEALTKLSVAAHKQRLRLAEVTKEAVRSQEVSSLGSLEERARAVWDQLESLLQGGDERRRVLRDIRINLEGLKEHVQLAAHCCESVPEALPAMRRYVQIAEDRFQLVQARLSPAYIEGEINTREAVHEEGYNYVVKQDFDTIGDTMKANSSTLKIYEDGIALGPAHSPHADIRKLGKGRYSHWGDSLYFSTSDNSDPKTNKRRYTYRAYSGNSPDSQHAAIAAQ